MDSKLMWFLFMALLSVVQGKDFSTLDHILPSSSPSEQTDAVTDLIKRLILKRAGEFSVTIDTSIGPPNRDTFLLVSEEDRIHVTGTSGVAAAWGFYYYLSQYCGCHVSWAGDQLNLPASLPSLPPGGVKVTSNDKFRYYQNVCTVSYSFVWWNWTRWEREIDWMVLNGYNLALAFQGQEEIWRRVYSEMGFTQAEIDQHLGGPAFLSWSRMGNIRGWGGPIPVSWHKQQVALQHRILKRMRTFGMTPVTPAFDGHVPRGFTRIFPNSSVTEGPGWGGMNTTYCCVDILDFEDPVFTQVGKAFLAEYIKEFGTNHVYNTDTFNELTPKSSEPSYLRSAGKAVFNSLLAADTHAIWLMQGWLFANEETFWQPPQAKALLTSVPKGRMIILDLWSEVRPQYERLESYYGQPFIWCMLHNFGGTISMYGVIDTVNKEPFVARTMANSSMVGTGLTPEGINQNDVIYAFMNENSWRKQPRNLTLWMQDYSTSRYGQSNKNADKAWQLLKVTVYNCTSSLISKHHSKNVITNLPKRKRMKIDGSVYNGSGSESDAGVITLIPQYIPPLNIHIWYNASDVYSAWDEMLLAAPALRNSNLFRYDFVDVTRQSLQVISTLYYNNIILAYKDKDSNKLREWGEGLLTLLSDLDQLLGSDEHFLLGRWIRDARNLGTTSGEKDQYEYNARKQITVWGTSSKQLVDYACKQWSGLVNSYYRQRWKLFIETLQTSLSSGTPYNETQFQQDVYCKVENPFTEDKSTYPTSPTGDQIKIAQELHEKYRPVTVIYSGFYSELKTASAAEGGYNRHMNRWLRKYQNSTRRNNTDQCKPNQSKAKLRHKAHNFSIIKDSKRKIIL